jgi:hypothetical protein
MRLVRCHLWPLLLQQLRPALLLIRKGQISAYAKENKRIVPRFFLNRVSVIGMKLHDKT